MKKDNKTCFSGYYDSKIEKKNIKGTSLSFIIPGIILMLCFLLKGIVSVGIMMTVYYALAFLGFMMIIGGTFFPKKLIFVHKKVLFLLNEIGILLLKIFLIIPYIITCFTLLIYANYKKKKFGFISWNDKLSTTTFFEKYNNTNDKKNERFFVISSLVTELFRHKMAILVPMVVLLIIIGIVFFFVTSSSVFPFIYTLF